ncbi:hypothetical protein N9406_07760 [Verrucomicrobiales bacterium]|nr:hypothetical protein [Verrucomicrobiales bacterium]MDB3940850.1 hypothetical protein [Verrucomicrobiales bacterium]
MFRYFGEKGFFDQFRRDIENGVVIRLFDAEQFADFFFTILKNGADGALPKGITSLAVRTLFEKKLDQFGIAKKGCIVEKGLFPLSIRRFIYR